MKLDDTFHMRRLDELDLEQFNALLRYAFQVTTTEMVKTGWSEEEIKREKLPMLTEGYVLGWFHNEHLASQIVIYPMEVNVEGEIVKMGGITGVTTYPEYAGPGVDSQADGQMPGAYADGAAVYFLPLPLLFSVLSQDGLGRSCQTS